MKENEQTENDPESIIVGEITMLLAAKRTSLAVMRTGIAILTLPFSVVTVLIATSRYYKFADNIMLIAPLMVLNTSLVFLSAYLIIRSVRRIHLQDSLINKLKEKDPHLLKNTDWEHIPHK